MRRELARQPFEEKIRKVGRSIQLAAKTKGRTAVEEPFNGAALSESVLAHDWKSPHENAAWRNL
jgi:hypothetical protein